MKRLRRVTAATAVLASVMMLAGCSVRKVVGRIVPGAISHVGVVDSSDERLGAPGIEGVEVTIMPAAGDGGGTIGRAVSKADGSFSIKIDSDKWSTDRVQVRASSDDYATARGSVYLPTGSRRLLILMERTAGD